MPDSGSLSLEEFGHDRILLLVNFQLLHLYIGLAIVDLLLDIKSFENHGYEFYC